MRARTLSWLLLVLALSPACNDMLSIHPPADQVLDAATGVDTKGVRSGDGDDAGAE
jgi:hypothetical protein